MFAIFNFRFRNLALIEPGFRLLVLCFLPRKVLLTISEHYIVDPLPAARSYRHALTLNMARQSLKDVGRLWEELAPYTLHLPQSRRPEDRSRYIKTV